MLSASSDWFTFSFPVWIYFSSFSCLIALAKIASAMSNNSVKSGHPCVSLVPDLGGNDFRFLPLTMFVL